MVERNGNLESVKGNLYDRRDYKRNHRKIL